MSGEDLAGSGMKVRAKKNIAAVSGLTGISRVLGFVRDMVLAWLLGAGFLADAFIVAFRIPNLLRRFMAEGAVSVAFVPVFSEAKERDGIENAFVLARGIFTLMFLVLTAVVIVGEIVAPAVVAVIAPGFINNEAFDTAVHLTRIMFPYILLIGIVALFMGILNSLGHFSAPAASPILLNVFMIGTPIVFYVMFPAFSSPADAFAWGVIFGGIAQVLLHVIPLRRLRVPLLLSWNFIHPRLMQVASLMGVAAIGASVYQINVFVGTLLASLLATGSVSYLYYANRIVELPLGLFAFAVGNVMLPSMSRAYARSDPQKLSSLVGGSVSVVMVFTIPATIGIMVLAEPIFSMLFLRGAFTMQDALASAYALRMYAIGLCAVGISRILTQALYAMQQARSVVRISWIVLAINILLCVALMVPMKHAGIALASSISVSFQVILLYRVLVRKGIRPGGVPLMHYARMIAAGIGMGICLIPFLAMQFWFEGFTLSGLGLLFLSIFSGAVVYFGLLWVLGFRQSYTM
ncbi:MAG TPA: murein biosynthesis integral membrane protein MurJ [Deltaproteobacteria bacterium]|nr:murein biosynthesis integral membrane protein MurJ [Deltaproteobacteria bacterium]